MESLNRCESLWRSCIRQTCGPAVRLPRSTQGPAPRLQTHTARSYSVPSSKMLGFRKFHAPLGAIDVGKCRMSQERDRSRQKPLHQFEGFSSVSHQVERRNYLPLRQVIPGAIIGHIQRSRRCAQESVPFRYSFHSQNGATEREEVEDREDGPLS